MAKLEELKNAIVLNGFTDKVGKGSTVYVWFSDIDKAFSIEISSSYRASVWYHKDDKSADVKVSEASAEKYLKELENLLIFHDPKKL